MGRRHLGRRRRRRGHLGRARLPGRAPAAPVLRASAAATTPSPAWKAPPAGSIVSNPFHPGPADSYQVIAPRAEPASYPATTGEASFTAAIRHINAVLAGEDEPRLLAVDTALGTAQALHDLTLSFTARAAVPGG